MTRKIAAALVAAAALGLSACASPEGTADTSTAPTYMTAESEPAVIADASEESYDFEAELNAIVEQVYLDAVAEYAYPSEEDALLVGYAACSLLDGGGTPATLAYELAVADSPVVPGFSNDDLPFFYGAAMGSLCPEYGKKYFG